jgi:hypothetical protein
MPMMYVSKKTRDLIDKIRTHFIKNKSGPTRVVQADVIHAAIVEYAKKLGVVKGTE